MKRISLYDVLVVVAIGILFLMVGKQKLGSGGYVSQYSVKSKGTFADATTTIFAVKNPNNSTTTLDYFEFNQTGVSTSTYVLTVGTSSTPYATPSGTLVTSVSIATGSRAFIINGGNIMGDSAGASSKDRIVVRPGEYIVGQVSSVYTNAFTNAVNTFDGTYKIGWYQ